MYFLNKSYYFKKITLISLLTLNCCAREENQELYSLDPEKPVITFERSSIAKWRNFTLSYEDYGPGFYSEKGEVLHASCSAPYPIKWDFDGFINPTSVLRIREPERTFNPDKFTIKLAVFFNTAQNEASLSASLRIQCEHVENYFKSDFSLYVKGNRNETLLSSKNKEIIDAWNIPCPTTTPQEPVALFKLNGDEEVKLEEEIEYVPWRGFHMNNFHDFEGVYLCRQGPSEIKFTAKLSSPPETVYSTTEEKLVMLSDEKLFFLICSSELEEDRAEFKFEDGFEAKFDTSFQSNLTWNKVVFITPVDKEAKRVEGKVSCVRNNVTVINWTFEFLKAPEIFFDDYFNEMHCLTDFEEGDGVEVEAKSVRCANEIGCSYYERCLEEENVCDHLGKVVYSDKRRTQCAPLADRIVRDCVNLDYTSWNGVALCKVEGFKLKWQYFTALNLHKYTDWRKVNESDLLRLEKDEENRFRCTGVGFLFANSLAFELEYNDNSTQLLQGEGKNGKVTIHGHPSPYKIQGFQVVSSLELSNPENVKSVRCVGPFWNRIKVIKTPFYKL